MALQIVHRFVLISEISVFSHSCCAGEGARTTWWDPPAVRSGRMASSLLVGGDLRVGGGGSALVSGD